MIPRLFGAFSMSCRSTFWAERLSRMHGCSGAGGLRCPASTKHANSRACVVRSADYPAFLRPIPCTPAVLTADGRCPEPQ